MNLYEQRARLIALLARVFGGVISYSDPEWPDWPVVYAELPTGQVSFHLHPENVAFLPFLPVVPDYPWDGHTRQEAFERLAATIELIPFRVLTHANPRLDTV